MKRLRLEARLGLGGTQALVTALGSNTTLTALTVVNSSAEEEELTLLFELSKARLAAGRGLAEMRINGMVWGGRGHAIPLRWLHWELLALEAGEGCVSCSAPHPHYQSLEREIQLMDAIVVAPCSAASAIREDGEDDEDDGGADMPPGMDMAEFGLSDY